MGQTSSDIFRQMGAVGLERGDTVLVHASMRKIGPVHHGPETIVQAILDVIGPTGNLVVPTHTAGNREPSTWTDPPAAPHTWAGLRESMPAFDPAVTPSQGMGVLAEVVRRRPDAVRSAHPQVSFAAVGPDNQRITAGHLLTCHHGEHSPLRRLEELDAKVLLLGVGWESCTAFHLAEYRRPDPPTRDYSCAVLESGRRRWVTYRDLVLDAGPFAEIGRGFEEDASRPVAVGPVGTGVGRLFRIRSGVEFALGWRHP